MRSCSFSRSARCFCARCSSSSASKLLIWDFSCVTYRWACGRSERNAVRAPPAWRAKASYLCFDSLQLSSQQLLVPLQAVYLQVPAGQESVRTTFPQLGGPPKASATGPPRPRLRRAPTSGAQEPGKRLLLAAPPYWLVLSPENSDPLKAPHLSSNPPFGGPKA